jgi:hypothetical protein
VNAARLACLIVCTTVSAGAQTLPSQPIVLADGQLTLGGEVSVAFGSEDPGFFNYTDYEHSSLRMLRIDLSAAVRLGEHLSVLGELRSENVRSPRPYALYLRFRPWTMRAFDIQVGRVPPTFGAFARRAYAPDSPLIGYPLGHQYLTSLRADAVPANADELLRMRGLGWLSRFSVGNQAPNHGVPLVTAFRWDTGVQLHAAHRLLDVTASLTTGTVADPRVTDNNGGKQIAGRLELHPATGLVVGGSAARGPFVSDEAARGAVGDGHTSEFTQTAWGADVEYSRNYYLLRFEAIVSDWRLPQVRPPSLALPLRAVSTSVEGRYKIVPGLYAAARFDHLGFSDIVGTGTTAPWDAPVTRVEIGGGYSLQRNLLLKISYQLNRRDGGRLPTRGNLGASQLVFWF